MVSTVKLGELLETIVAKQQIQNATIEIKPASQKGDGLVGIMTAVTINGANKEGEPLTLNIMAKQAPQSPAFRSTMPIRKVFEREIYVYTRLMPLYKNFELVRNAKEKFNGVTECFGTSLEENHEIILLQNLNYSGYKMWDKLKTMDDLHIKLLLDKYAHLHAFSFAFRDQQPEVFEEMKKECVDPQSMENLEKLSKGFYCHFDNIIDAFNEDEIIVNFVKGLKREMLDTFKKSKVTDEFSVIVHGDCWCCNMMFSYEESNPEIPKNVILLDWQMTKLSSVCSDLCFFFYCSSSLEVINNYKHYMEFYYSKLVSHVKLLGSNIEGFYTFETFKEHWMFYRTIGLMISLVVAKKMVASNEEIPDVAQGLESGKKFFEVLNFKTANDKVYLNRMKNLILHFLKTRDD